MKIKRFFSVVLTLFAVATLFFSSALPAHAQEIDFIPELEGQCRRAIVDYLNIRKEFGTDEPVVKTLSKGQKIFLTGYVFPEYQGFPWYEVYRSDAYGWVAGGKPGRSYIGYCQ